jgi:hypothetical protein
VADDDRRDRPPVGSVAEEAARLLEALSDLTGGYRPHHEKEGTAAEHTAAEHHEGQDTASEDTASPVEGRCEHCGARNGTGQAVVCQLCPVCQGLGLLRALRPETVDRLADFAGAVAATLRDLAVQQPEPPRAGARGARPRRGGTWGAGTWGAGTWGAGTWGAGGADAGADAGEADAWGTATDHPTGTRSGRVEDIPVEDVAVDDTIPDDTDPGDTDPGDTDPGDTGTAQGSGSVRP